MLMGIGDIFKINFVEFPSIFFRESSFMLFGKFALIWLLKIILINRYLFYILFQYFD